MIHLYSLHWLKIFITSQNISGKGNSRRQIYQLFACTNFRNIIGWSKTELGQYLKLWMYTTKSRIFNSLYIFWLLYVLIDLPGGLKLRKLEIFWRRKWPKLSHRWPNSFLTKLAKEIPTLQSKNWDSFQYCKVSY